MRNFYQPKTGDSKVANDLRNVVVALINLRHQLEKAEMMDTDMGRFVREQAHQFKRILVVEREMSAAMKKSRR